MASVVRKFINNQTGPVTVYNERKQAVLVSPHTWKGRTQGIFVVEGEHYAQFVHPYGPLSPFPDNVTDGPPHATPAKAVATPVRAPAPKSTAEKTTVSARPLGTGGQSADTMTGEGGDDVVDSVLAGQVEDAINKSGMALDQSDRTELLTYTAKRRAGHPYKLDDSLSEMIPALDKIADASSDASGGHAGRSVGGPPRTGTASHLRGKTE